MVPGQPRPKLRPVRLPADHLSMENRWPAARPLTTDSPSAVVPAVAVTAAAIAVGFALVSSTPAPAFVCLSLVRQLETGQRHAGETNAKFF